MNRMAKLTGAKLSFHAPMVDPTGITEQGWNKINQDAAERQLWDAVKKSQDLNPGENVVTFHAASVGLPPAEMKVMENGEERIKSFLTVDPFGKIQQIKAEEKFFPTEPGIARKDYFASEAEVQAEIDRRNREAWTENLARLDYYAHMGQDATNSVTKADERFGKILKEKEKGGPEWKETLEEEEKQIARGTIHADLYLRDAYRAIKKNYDDLYKNLDAEDKKKLDAYAKKVSPDLKKFESAITDAEGLRRFSEIVEEGVKTLRDVKQPNVLRPLKDFAIEKSAETTANIALKGYNTFHDKAPVIALENHPAQMSVISTGEDLRKVIEKSREMFIKEATKQGMSSGEASKQAEKLIGATWDVGHINMMRRYGYDKTDIISQTEQVAPFVKKVHLSDNFGFEHTELPMGMGNVPMAEIMEKIGKEGFNVKKVIEAGNWWQHFSPGGKVNSPLIPTLQAFGTELYSGANFNQAYGPGGYFSGYGTMLPEQNFSMYGAGFSSLPTELGGQIASKDSRFSGTPMA